MMYVTDYWYQYTAVAALCVFFFSAGWVKPRFGVPASLLFACSAYSSIWCWLFVQNRYVSVDPYNQMALRYFACDSIAKIMLIVVPMMVFSDSRQTMRFMGEIVGSLFVFISSIYAIWEARLGCGDNRCGGLIGNPSISMGMMICILPIFVRSWRSQWFVLAPAILAVFVSQSSVALGLLAAYFGLWFFPWRSFREGVSYGRLGVSFAGTFGILFLGKIALGGELTNDSDRFKIWRFMFDRWRAPWNILTGTGEGTYHVFSVNLQAIPGKEIAQGYWWNTLHNDWLQMLFECGAVGALLLFLAYGSALFKIIKEKDWGVAISIVLYGLYMSMDPALHNPIPVLFGAWLFVYALRRENQYKEYV